MMFQTMMIQCSNCEAHPEIKETAASSRGDDNQHINTSKTVVIKIINK